MLLFVAQNKRRILLTGIQKTTVRRKNGECSAEKKHVILYVESMKWLHDVITVFRLHNWITQWNLTHWKGRCKQMSNGNALTTWQPCLLSIVVEGAAIAGTHRSTLRRKQGYKNNFLAHPTTISNSRFKKIASRKCRSKTPLSNALNESNNAHRFFGRKNCNEHFSAALLALWGRDAFHFIPSGCGDQQFRWIRRFQLRQRIFTCPFLWDSNIRSDRCFRSFIFHRGWNLSLSNWSIGIF